jgi:hypothetical protein
MAPPTPHPQASMGMQHSLLQVHIVPSLMASQAAADLPQVANAQGIHVFRRGHFTKRSSLRTWEFACVGTTRVPALSLRLDTWVPDTTVSRIPLS